jgi:hypothetical protein
MYLYGQSLIGDEDDEPESLWLREVTILADAPTLRKIARFLESVADEIEQEQVPLDSVGWHMHYRDFLRDESDEQFWGGDVLVMQPYPPRDDLGDPGLARLPPLVRAARLGRAEAVGELLEGGQDPNETGPDGYGALHAACEANAPHVVEMLLKAGAAVDSDG